MHSRWHVFDGAFAADKIIAGSTITFAATLAVLAFVRIPALIILFLIAGGFAWTSTMSTLNVSVQLSVPSWVRARAIGSYQMILQGGMALGGVIWGFVAEHVLHTGRLGMRQRAAFWSVCRSRSAFTYYGGPYRT